VRYGAAVQDRIKVRPGQLVAIDRAPQAPEVVWRWMTGTVEEVAGDRVAVTRSNAAGKPLARDDGERTWLGGLDRPARRPAPGDLVFFCTVDEPEVADIAREGVPSEPERLRAEYFPIIERAHAAGSPR